MVTPSVSSLHFMLFFVHEDIAKHGDMYLQQSPCVYVRLTAIGNMQTKLSRKWTMHRWHDSHMVSAEVRGYGLCYDELVM